MSPSTSPASNPSLFRRRGVIVGTIAVCILVAASIAAYIVYSGREIAIADANISAPSITLAPSAAGRLNTVYVNPGDTVAAGEAVALVGTEVVRSKIAGLIISVNDTVGAQVSPGENVVTMIDPTQLRVVGKIDENKGLSRIAVGDPVVFTVDAFSGKTYKGVVDQVAPTANSSGIVFDISNERQTEQFNVEARFDENAYPDLRNGMSARMYVYPSQ